MFLYFVSFPFDTVGVACFGSSSDPSSKVKCYLFDIYSDRVEVSHVIFRYLR